MAARRENQNHEKKFMPEKSEAKQPDVVVREIRFAVEKISAAAEKLKNFSELQSLKENRIDISVNQSDILESTRRDQARDARFGDLRDLLALLNLLACAGG
jgi:hypothetical protein